MTATSSSVIVCPRCGSSTLRPPRGHQRLGRCVCCNWPILALRAGALDGSLPDNGRAIAPGSSDENGSSGASDA